MKNYDQNSSGMAGVLERNIEALLKKRKEQEMARNIQERIADKITAFTGSMKFVYIHILLFGAWSINSLGLTPFRRSIPAL
jgi:uncharacterized membrane protein